MAFSGLTLHYAITDINAYLPARIQKIQVLSYDQFILHLLPMRKSTGHSLILVSKLNPLSL